MMEMVNAEPKEYLRITSDGRVQAGDGLTMDEAAEQFLRLCNARFAEVVANHRARAALAR
jgi:hypothetical protein